MMCHYYMLDRYPQFWSDAFKLRGRISRIDYWTIVVMNVVISCVFTLMSGELAWVFGVSVILPFFTMQIRRIRDTGRAWLWIFISLLPLISQLWLLWILIGPLADQLRIRR